MKIKRSLKLFILFALLIAFVQCKNNKNNPGDAREKAGQQATKPGTREKPTLVYDDRKNITERHNNSYRSDGTIRSRDSYFYTYDEHNNVIKEVKESVKPDGSFNFKNVNYYQYDDRNLMIDLVFESYDENEGLLRTAHHSFNYNERGHKIEDIGYDTAGKVISRIILYPDDDGALLAEEYIYYDGEGKIIDHKKHYYTKFGLEKSVDLLKDSQ